MHIEKEKGPQPPNSIPVTMDVVGMYNNIEHEEEMDCIRKALNSSKFMPVLPSFFLYILSLVPAQWAFIKHCNSFHHSIKFTFEYSFETKSVNFLDMIIWIDINGFLQTDLFKKAGKIKEEPVSLPKQCPPKTHYQRNPIPPGL